MEGTRITATKQFVVHTNQFILSRIDARNGAFGLVPETLDGAIVTQDFPVFTIDRVRLIPEFLEWMSKTHWFRKCCEAASEGTTNRVRLKEDRFLATRIPLPTIEQQMGIVSRIEHIMTRIDDASIRRKKVATESNSLLQSALDLLFSEVQSDSPNVRLLEISTLITKGATPTTYGFAFADNGIPFLRAENVVWGPVNCEDTLFITPAAHEFLSRSQTMPGDVLVCIAGTIGRSAYVPDDAPAFNMNQAVALVRLKPVASPKYVAMIVQASAVQRQIRGAKVTNTISNLSLSRIRLLTIPIPSLERQEQIVTRFEQFRSRIVELKMVHEKIQHENEILPDAVLRTAFEGRL